MIPGAGLCSASTVCNTYTQTPAVRRASYGDPDAVAPQCKS